MKAMIFAAGLGSRLKPITNDRPKALAEIHETPLIEIVIRRMISYGYNEIIINVHHYADMIMDFLKSKNNFNINIRISDETGQLLDTGGGLKKASWFFDDKEPFLLHNVDTITDVNLRDFYNYHKKQNALATVLVRHRSGSRFFLFDSKTRLCGWENIISEEKILVSNHAKHLEQIAFSCLHIIDPQIFNLLTEEGSFSIVNSYLRLAKDHTIIGYVDDQSYWMDVGTPEKLHRCEKDIDVERFVVRQ